MGRRYLSPQLNNDLRQLTSVQMLGKIFIGSVYIPASAKLSTRGGVDFTNAKTYSCFMGIFSKSKPKDASGVSEESLLGFISKFQKMIPDDFTMEINGKNYDSSKLREVVDALTRLSSKEDDRQLLHFVARACVVAGEEFGKLEIEKIAETLFDDFGVSGEIRRRYSSNQQVVEGVTALGVASISILEKNPKYPAVLEYLSANAEKLGSR